MSDLLTHWAVADDVCRLALADDQVAAPLCDLIRTEQDYLHLGAVSRRGKSWVPHFMRQGRDRAGDLAGDALLRRKVAFALGGIVHYPADFYLKPLMSRLARADWERTHHQMQAGQPGQVSIREISAYYDVHVFRQVYLSGHEAPFNRFLLADNLTAPGQALEAFVRALFQRALLSSHTFSPDQGDVDGWAEALFARVQPLYIQIALYTQVYERPDGAKQEAFAVETEFYRMDDPAIALARHVQLGGSLTTDALDAALSDGANRSGYGQAVALGVRVLRDASRFWRGDTDTPPDVSQG